MTKNTILPEIVEKKYEKEIDFIRNCAKTNEIKISDHCYQQLASRKIKIKDVYESVRSGVVLEVQTLERDIKIVFQDCVNIPPEFFSVVAVKSPLALFITAYLPDQTKWCLGSDNQWRRK